jgi:predicted nucleotidyltransferase
VRRHVLSKDLRDFLRLLDRHRVEYLVCGGHAVAFHGYPRLTMDLDILVRPSPENAGRVVAALADFGFGNAGVTADVFTHRGTAVTLGVQPNQLDLLTSMGRSDDDSVFAAAVPGEIDGIAVRYVSLKDLLRAKREADRAKDRADVEELERFHGHRSGCRPETRA